MSLLTVRTVVDFYLTCLVLFHPNTTETNANFAFCAWKATSVIQYPCQSIFSIIFSIYSVLIFSVNRDFLITRTRINVQFTEWTLLGLMKTIRVGKD